MKLSFKNALNWKSGVMLSVLGIIILMAVIPNANEFSVSSGLEYVVPARAELQTKSNLSSGNL